MTIEESRFETASSSSSSSTSRFVPDLTGHTLVLPCVSIGSVPQLAIDALLEPKNASMSFPQQPQQQAGGVEGGLIPICSLDHRFCIPFLGGESKRSASKGKQELQEPLQVFSFGEEKVTIVQQRSPILKSRKADFVSLLMEWIHSKKFSQVIILTSLDAGLRVDAEMSHPFWYYSAGKGENNGGRSTTASDSFIKRLKLAKIPSLLDQRINSSNTAPALSPKPSFKVPPMPSGGLARTYLEAALGSSPNTEMPPVHALITFAAEGDNRSDALAMAALLCQLLGLPTASPQLSEPYDWSLLFGSQTDDSMFN